MYQSIESMGRSCNIYLYLNNMFAELSIWNEGVSLWIDIIRTNLEGIVAYLEGPLKFSFYLRITSLQIHIDQVTSTDEGIYAIVLIRLECSLSKFLSIPSNRGNLHVTNYSHHQWSVVYELLSFVCFDDRFHQLRREGEIERERARIGDLEHTIPRFAIDRQ